MARLNDYTREFRYNFRLASPVILGMLAWYAISDVTIYGLEGFFENPPEEDFTP